MPLLRLKKAFLELLSILNYSHEYHLTYLLITVSSVTVHYFLCNQSIFFVIFVTLLKLIGFSIFIKNLNKIQNTSFICELKALDNILENQFSLKYKNYGWLLFIHRVKYVLTFLTSLLYLLKNYLFINDYLTLCYLFNVTIIVICTFLLIELFAINAIHYKFLKNNKVFKGDKNLIAKRHVFTTTKNVLIFCRNCAGVAAIGSITPEVMYKSVYGPNAMSPWREYHCNYLYPDDVTGTWTETKLARAQHNVSMGLPYDAKFSLKDNVTLWGHPKK